MHSNIGIPSFTYPSESAQAHYPISVSGGIIELIINKAVDNAVERFRDELVVTMKEQDKAAERSRDELVVTMKEHLTIFLNRPTLYDQELSSISSRVSILEQSHFEVESNSEVNVVHDQPLVNKKGQPRKKKSDSLTAKNTHQLFVMSEGECQKNPSALPRSFPRGTDGAHKVLRSGKII